MGIGEGIWDYFPLLGSRKISQDLHSDPGQEEKETLPELDLGVVFFLIFVISWMVFFFLDICDFLDGFLGIFVISHFSIPFFPGTTW